MRRSDLETNVCPVARTLNVVGDCWSLLLVRDALRGRARFSEFQKSLGLAKNILAARLKGLVEEGIFELQPAADGSAYQEYVLTAKGRAFEPVLAALATWGTAHTKAPTKKSGPTRESRAAKEGRDAGRGRGGT